MKKVYAVVYLHDGMKVYEDAVFKTESDAIQYIIAQATEFVECGFNPEEETLAKKELLIEKEIMESYKIDILFGIDPDLPIYIMYNNGNSCIGQTLTFNEPRYLTNNFDEIYSNCFGKALIK